MQFNVSGGKAYSTCSTTVICMHLQQSVIYCKNVYSQRHKIWQLSTVDVGPHISEVLQKISTPTYTHLI